MPRNTHNYHNHENSTNNNTINLNRPFDRHHQNTNTMFNLNHQNDANTTTTINLNRPFISPSKSNPKHLLYLLLKYLIFSSIISLFFLFIGITITVVIFFILAGGDHHRRNRRGPTSDEGVSSSGYSSDQLNSLAPVSPFMGPETCCAVCLNSIFENDCCRILPECHHVFHVGCVDKWLVKVPACPVCRSRVGCLENETGYGGGRGGSFDWEQFSVSI